MDGTTGTSQNNVNCLNNICFHRPIKMEKSLNLILEILNPNDIKDMKCFLPSWVIRLQP